MKKILTIAIAFVMVFALASTALAAGWDIVVKEKEVEDIKITIDALSGATEEVNNKYWNPEGDEMWVVLEKTYPVVLDDLVHAVVTVEFPKEGKLSDDMKEYIENGQLKLTLTNSGCVFTKVKANTVNQPTIEDDEIVKYFSEKAYGKTYTFEVWAKVDKAKVDAKIVATLGVYNEWKSGVFTWEVDDETYTAYHGDKQFTVKTPDGEQVTFFVEGAAKEADESSKIDVKKAILVSYDGTNFYAVSKQVNNELAFGPETALITSGSDYKKLAAALEEVLDVLGFTYEGVKYMSEAHFLKYFGTIMETEVSKVWPSGYVVELDTVDPSIVPPQTGDNTSVVGFAMIVVALVAAVVLKKVRA